MTYNQTEAATARRDEWVKRTGFNGSDRAGQLENRSTEYNTRCCARLPLRNDWID